MSLSQMLETFDELSLEAISSKGIVRRAKRDLTTSDHTVLDTSDDSGKVKTDGHTVILPALGPANATCTCPATGVCRHIVLSVLALKNDSNPSLEKAEIDQVATPASSLKPAKVDALQLTEAQLKKYAGADWQQALVVADSHDDVKIIEHGLNCTLSLADTLVKITLISGQSLKESLYKGPKSKQRLLTTVCILLLRTQSGIPLEQVSNTLRSETPPIDTDFINAAKHEVVMSVGAVLNGTPEIAVNRFYDLSISARVQVVPRLVSQLRTLAKQAALATARHVQFQPSAYIKLSASTYSLLLALEKNPNDSALTGVLKRDFNTSNPLELRMLGATKWRTPNGARGITAYGYSSQTDQWYSATNARAAGSDPLFDPVSAYYSQLWNAGILTDLIGHNVLLEQPSVSADNQISLTLKGTSQVLTSPIDSDQLIASEACFSTVLDLKAYLSESLGYGIKRSPAPKPFLFAPTSYTTPYFNDIDQIYGWGLVDSFGNVIELRFSGDQTELVNYLVSIQYKINALLITAEYSNDDIEYKLCSVLSQEKGSLHVHNVSFDTMANTKTMLEKIKSRISSYTSTEHSISEDPILRLTESVIDTCVKSSTSKVSNTDYQSLSIKADTLGLETLSSAINQQQSSNTTVAMLKTAYIASEIQLMAHTS